MAEGHRQCRLRRGTTEQVSYIPARYAHVGRVLELRDEAGVWTGGWVVITAGPLRPSEWVRERGDDYRHQREGSDA